MSTEKGAVVVIGAGDGTGGAIARRFAREGHPAAVVRRKQGQLRRLVQQIEGVGGRAQAYGADSRDEEQVIRLFDAIELDLGEIDVVVYNAAVGAGAPIADLEARVFRTVWETDCFGAFLVGREGARRMLPAGKGTILFTGATAALRGRAGVAAFAAAKHGQRALAQSMARELGPKGIHVGHVIIDGPIDGEFVRSAMPKLVEERPGDGILAPDDIAEAYWNLHMQPRSAWTHEIDLRPWVEPW